MIQGGRPYREQVEVESQIWGKELKMSTHQNLRSFPNKDP